MTATLFSILRRRALSIHTRLTILTLATVLPLVAVGGFAVIRTVDDQKVRVEQDVAKTVDGLLGDIDRQIIAIEAELQVLAVSPSLQSEDLYPFYQQMNAALPLQGTAIVLLDTKGQQLLSTNQPFGAELPPVTNTEMSERVVATGKPQVSDLVMGALLHRPIVGVGVPVFHNGKVVRVLIMGLGSEILSKLLRQPDLSPDWVIAIFDRKGLIVARDRELDRFLGKPAAPIIRQAIAGPVEGWIPNVTSEGIPVYSTFRRSAVTGWTVAIGVPRGFVDTPRWRAQFLAFGGGVAVLALSLFLAWWMAQAIRRPVEALTAATKALASGVPIGELNGGVRELNQVGNALHATAAALARHREQLEGTVALRTQELRAEIEARKQAEATLLQSQKMEAVGQLTGGVAHDFNNLLTIASGSLEMLEARISDERGLYLLRNAQDAMSRGARLTTSLLAFARKQRLEPVLADLNSVITDMDEMLRRSLGPSVEIRYALASELWPVEIDLGQFETALLNIAINARDAMPGGGILLFETANVPAPLREEVAGRDCVLVSVHDNGTGMSPDVIEHAFEPFFTTKEIGRGTGLGLSMVFGVVSQSGGAVRLRSELGKGTTVLIYLPRAAHATLPAAGSAASAGVQSGAGAQILVVDDDAAVRWVTVECLREAGYRVAEADSGRAALTLLERNDPCDLVVMDHVMPGITGQDTVCLARRARPELKVLFLSGYAAWEEAGGDLWLQKPFKGLGRGRLAGASVIAQILLQLTSAAASVGRVKTSSHIVSRRFNALALGAVAADFAVKYARTPRADYLVGLILFVVLTARTLLILGFSKIEGNTFRRRVACAVAFLVCAVASIAGQFYLSEPIRPLTLLPLVGIGLGCLGEASNNMIVRRRCVLAMGCVMAAFGLATEAWGLVFKNLVSDVGATIYSMNKYRDPPLPALAVRYKRRQSAG